MDSKGSLLEDDWCLLPWLALYAPLQVYGVQSAACASTSGLLQIGAEMAFTATLIQGKEAIFSLFFQYQRPAKDAVRLL
jgi:hypothetical protein